MILLHSDHMGVQPHGPSHAADDCYGDYCHRSYDGNYFGDSVQQLEVSLAAATLCDARGVAFPYIIPHTPNTAHTYGALGYTGRNIGRDMFSSISLKTTATSIPHCTASGRISPSAKSMPTSQVGMRGPSASSTTAAM